MKYFYFLFSLVFLFSCNNSKPRIEVVEDENLSQVEIDSILDEYSFQYDRLTFIDSTNYVLFPIKTQSTTKGRFKRGSYSDDWHPKYWNILFYNSETEETNLLTESKVRILDFKANINYAGSQLKKSILYKMGDTDYNKDQKYNYNDPHHLFISNIDGTGLTRISPLNENLEDYSIIPKTDKIIFKTTRDTDKNFKFNENDEIIWYHVDVSKEMKLTEVIKPSERKKIETLYFKQWLVKNEK